MNGFLIGMECTLDAWLDRFDDERRLNRWVRKPISMFEAVSWQRLPPIDSVWVQCAVPRCQRPPAGAFPITQSYLDQKLCAMLRCAVHCTCLLDVQNW